jgi:hypothetical protein
VRLSDAFLHGRLYLIDNPSWLNELIPNPSGTGYFVVYPPFPAVLMTPFVAIWGLGLNQTLFGLFFAAATVPLAYLVSRAALTKLKTDAPVSRKTCIWFAVLFGFGTIFWYLSSIGSVWLIAQVIATFFMMLALYEGFTRNRPLLVGLLVGASFFADYQRAGHILFAALAVLHRSNTLAKQVQSVIAHIAKLAAVWLFLCSLLRLQYVRIAQCLTWILLIPDPNEPWFYDGHFSLLYIADNLSPSSGLQMLTSTAPYVRSQRAAANLVHNTPFCLRAQHQDSDRVTWCSWLTVFCIAAVIFTNAATGWGFGYRYAVDFYPFLFLLTVRGMGAELKWYHKVLIIVGVVVNLVGVVAINKFPDVRVLT